MTTTAERGAATDPIVLLTDVDSPRKRKGSLTYYFMLFPAIGLFTLFIAVPAVMGLFYSFTNSVGYGKWKFIGFTNYTSGLSDPAIRDSYLFTFKYAIVTTILVNVIALVLALILNGKIKWKLGFRTLYFLPMVISGLVISLVFEYLFSTSMPAIAHDIGLPILNTNILASPSAAWIAVVIVGTWQACPGAIIIYLAGIISIPTEVYEASSIDGATTWDKFRRITLPLLFPYVMINSILTLKNSLNVYDIIVGLTNGGPGTSTYSVTFDILNGFSGGDFAYQLANSIMFFIVVVLVALIQAGVGRRLGGSKS
jgi:raffinose/stachyose/melibiose transport system permease protein